LAEKPSLTAVQVKKIIMDTVDVLPKMAGKTATGGRVNALKAIQKAKTYGVE